MCRDFDSDLIELLLDDQDVKEKFFKEINGHWIFNSNTFVDYISDKNFRSNSYTKYRDKVGLSIDNKFFRERGEVALVWPFKDCVLVGGQTDEKRSLKNTP